MEDPRGGIGNPLQDSCLQNPMSSGASWATVQGGRKESDTAELLGMRAHQENHLYDWEIQAGICKVRTRSFRVQTARAHRVGGLHSRGSQDWNLEACIHRDGLPRAGSQRVEIQQEPESIGLGQREAGASCRIGVHRVEKQRVRFIKLRSLRLGSIRLESLALQSMPWGQQCESEKVSPSCRTPHGLWPTRLLCAWDSPGENTGGGCHSLLQGIFPIQGSNLGLPR